MFLSNLKTIRKNAGIKVKTVSEKLGISRITLWQWENGKRTPGIEDLARLAQLYECTVDDLIGKELKKSLLES